MHSRLFIVVFMIAASAVSALQKRAPETTDYEMRQNQDLVQKNAIPQKVFLRIDPLEYQFVMNADYLFQRVYRRGMDFAVNTFPTGPAAQLPNGVTFTTGYSFSNGYELSGAFRTPNRWCIEIFYMHFDTKSSKNIAQTPQTLSATRGLAGTIGVQGAYDQAKAKARLDWDIYTLEFARAMSLGEMGEFKPYVGLRWAYIDQDFEALYIRSVATSSVDKVIEETHSSLIGAVLGFRGKFHFVKHFGILGNLDLAFMRADQKLTNLQLNNDVQEVNYKELFVQIVPALETALGVFANWEYFTVALGYHFKYWADAAFSARSDADDSKLGQFIPVEYDLSLSGLFVGFELTF